MRSRFPEWEPRGGSPPPFLPNLGSNSSRFCYMRGSGATPPAVVTLPLSCGFQPLPSVGRTGGGHVRVSPTKKNVSCVRGVRVGFDRPGVVTLALVLVFGSASVRSFRLWRVSHFLVFSPQLSRGVTRRRRWNRKRIFKSPGGVEPTRRTHHVRRPITFLARFVRVRLPASHRRGIPFLSS
ncbi:hypothetical protein SAMN05421858_5131 [Haladaptatus litoreus]|uniref:Uncharacterized protein n=1 Tax=Haladaptatus litoreus TaxID=553468 RepID=A0A1N7FKC4_9EURY|nr:hypothetical protein SAMN05421858_5131 [Haladaptatus litoreus]